jgi:hypothetical protein
MRQQSETVSNRKHLLLVIGWLFLFAGGWADRFPQTPTASLPAAPLYETRADHDPNGTGKFYMGREIAQVMGPGGIPWLDRPERESEEKPEEVIKAMKLRGDEVIADLGAGSGYYSFRLATKVHKLLAVELQDEMIRTLRRRAADQKVANLEVVRGRSAILICRPAESTWY